MSDDLVTWLAAQYDQAEQAAKAATPGPWSFSGDEPRTPTAEGGFTIDADSVVDTPGLPWGSVHPSDVVGAGYDVPSGVFRRTDAVHIAAHDPAWRLADIVIKRQILADHEVDDFGVGGHGVPRDEYDPPPICTRCQADHEEVEWPCVTVRLLASEFAGRPGYRDEWKPLRSLGRHASGGTIPGPGSDSDSIPVMLSPGGPVTDPDEAEVLGLTADARRMRRDRT